MNCKRLQVGQFWSARPRGHNRRLHQVRPNYSCISCLYHRHNTFQLKIYTRYFRQLLGGFVLPIPLFHVVSPGGREGGLEEDFAVSHPARGETIYCACKTSEHVSVCTYVPWKVSAALIAKFLKFAKQESNKVQLAACRLRL